jgi:hypothetical protein
MPKNLCVIRASSVNLWLETLPALEGKKIRKGVLHRWVQQERPICFRLPAGRTA